jgi:hypothetical protein
MFKSNLDKSHITVLSNVDVILLKTTTRIVVMGKVLELAGQKFGRLTVFCKNPERGVHRHVQWDCICECGNRRTLNACSLVSGHTTSCGCYQSERVTTHGMKGTPEYNSWFSMKDRCYRKDNPRYHDYGGRGITVCDRWLESFENFYEDMGDKPGPGYSIERKDNNLGYFKDNCKWATKIEQANNRRDNVLFEYKGNKHTSAELSRLPEAIKNGLSAETIRTRIERYGFSVEKAISRPVRRYLFTYQHQF